MFTLGVPAINIVLDIFSFILVALNFAVVTFIALKEIGSMHSFKNCIFVNYTLINWTDISSNNGFSGAVRLKKHRKSTAND